MCKKCEDKTRFSHLHVHTDCSPDGLSTVSKLVNRAAEMEFDSLAMTDHGTLGNSITFWTACQAAGIKPILGLEAYMLWESQRYHVTLNSMNKAGFDNLIRLSNAAHKNYISGYPMMTIDMMDEYNEGIAAFTGCPASPIHAGEYEDGLNWAGQMSDIFKGRFYGEMMFVIEEDVVNRPLKIARELGLPILVTNDVHFPLDGQQQIHKIMTECRKGYNYESDRLWLKGYDDMVTAGLKLFSESEIKEWLITSWEFAAKVEPWDIHSKPNLPVATELEEDLYRDLRKNLIIDLDRYPAPEAEKRLDRFEYELQILESADFIDYFGILYDITKFAKENEILIGPGRGSAASSYLLYLLGITDLDPIYYDLPFERFMNPMRKEYPDVDLDFDSDRRPEIIKYANEKWGAVPIATYSHYTHKVLVNDLGRNLGISPAITKDAAERGRESKAFDLFCTQHPNALPAYEAMDGQIRHTGKHAGGIIITDQMVPIEMVGGVPVAAWTQGADGQLSNVGVVKFDILGVQALSQIREMRRLTHRVSRPEPEEYPEVLDIFRSGDVLGVFQWTGSDGIRHLTMDISPQRFSDLVVINSLYRPGALDAGTAEQYPDLMVNPRKFHPLVDPVLEETFGAIVFQEQVMRLIQIMLKGTLAEADMARRLIFKPKPDKKEWVDAVEKMHRDFIAGGIDQGIKRETMNLLWSEIITHSRYSFNKSHSASYSLLAFEMAFFKQKYPAIFYSVMMTSDVANQQSYMIEAISKGIEFLPPDINAPTSKFEIVDDKVQMPISIVKYLSAESADFIREEFETNGKFISFKDFDKRIPGKKCNVRPIRFLWYLGAFDSLSGDLLDIPRFTDYPANLSKSEAQMEALGFVIPTPGVAKLILSHDKSDYAVGYVQDWSDRINKRGDPYRVYYLAPYGSFWTSDTDRIAKIKKGMLIEVTKNNWGMAKRIARLTEKE